MKLVFKDLEGKVVQRRIKDWVYEGDTEGRNSALVIVELDDTLTYLPIDQFICEEWTDDTVVVKEDWAWKHILWNEMASTGSPGTGRRSWEWLTT